jgi:hypothetical protein
VIYVLILEIYIEHACHLYNLDCDPSLGFVIIVITRFVMNLMLICCYL